MTTRSRNEQEFQEIKPYWDVFKEEPIKIESGSMAKNDWLDFLLNISKILTCILTFSIVLAASVISKMSLVFMTSQVFNQKTLQYCTKERLNYKDLLVVNTNFSNFNDYAIVLPQIERVAWIWMIIVSFFFKELLTFLQSLRTVCFKRFKRPKMQEFLIVAITESFSAIGNAILVFEILSKLDVIKAVMITSTTCIVPSIIGLLSRNFKREKYVIPIDLIAIFTQSSGLIVLHFLDVNFSSGLVLLSVGFSENYLSDNASIGLIRNLAKKRKGNQYQRHYCYLFISIWKCLLFFVFSLYFIDTEEQEYRFIFWNFKKAFSEHLINITNVNLNSLSVISTPWAPFWVLITHIISSYLVYAFSKFAYKVSMHHFAYALPINLATPLTITVLFSMYYLYIMDNCMLSTLIPAYLSFDFPPIEDVFINRYPWISILWTLSQLWVTLHLWSDQTEKIIRTDRLFIRPYYESFLIDQSMALNTRRSTMRNLQINKKADKEITKIYACATMWHETDEEMMEFLKSIMRLDQDQSHKKLAKNLLGDVPYDYYELETHIFFDDAFVRKDQEDHDPLLNEYVKILIDSVGKAAYEVHEVKVYVKQPDVYKTPYGGRLVWILPGKTKMIAHLKDVKKIQVKKRWSQVMYMYYLLGHRLMEPLIKTREEQHVDFTEGENIYLLALDGDVDFQPEAVHLLVERMRKNKSLGAACGRIHPLGSGPLVWFQMFEYAVGHWLQKATEHMIGCVLCSPGCFSLFRASALMSTNVMRKYATRSERALDFVQYDQGEDRWLCTLLLQQKYRVEYCAASDAFTHCPETFNEFYNQRRRWMPSTTANILDLLMNYKRVIKINDSISRPYIFYQTFLMAGTILAPGTIFLMLVGALVAVFQLSQWQSFLYNAIPVLTFMATCFLFDTNIQLIVAKLLSAIYGLVMMAVLVGVVLQISADGVFAPSSLFFFCVVCEFLITGLLHPKEINCLPYGFIYYITVPSMYLLLNIYSIFNLNNVSWGTREVTNKKPEEENEGKMFKLFKTNENLLNSLFSKDKKSKLKCISNSLDEINKKLDQLIDNKSIDTEPSISNLKKESIKEIDQIRIDISTDQIEDNSWINYEKLGDYKNLSKDEESFWKEILKTYLRPIVPGKAKKEKIAQDLKDLRDKAAFAIFMLNALFVLIIMLLTIQKDFIHVQWPFPVNVNFTYIHERNEIHVYKEYLQLEPIGFVFLFSFFALLIVQFVAMIFHRLSTFTQIIRNTRIGFKSKNKKKMIDKDEDPIEIVQDWAKLKDSDEEQDCPVECRRTVRNLMKTRKRRNIDSIEDAFNLRREKYRDQHNFGHS